MKKIIVNGVKNTTKKAKSVSKLDTYRQSAKGIITRGVKAGHGDNMKRVLGTLDVNELVKSKQGLENLKRKMRHIRQIPTLIKDRERYENKRDKSKLVKEAKKISGEQVREVIDEYGHKVYCDMYYEGKMGNLPQFEDYNDMDVNELRGCIDEMESVPLIVRADMLQIERIDGFFHNYFREIELNEIEGKQIEALKETFKGKLAEFNDFQEIVTGDKFKGHEYDKSDADNYQDVMASRLKRMLEMRGIKTDKKGNVIK